MIPLALAASLLLAAIGLRNEAVAISGKIISGEDHYYLPPAAWMKVFSLGYNEAAADVLWATTLVYFGGKKHWSKEQGGAEKIDTPRFTVNYLALVSKLDPRFIGVYQDGGRLTLYHTGQITEDSVKMAIELLETGRRYFPNDGEIAFNLGFLHYYEMDPFLPNEKDAPARRYHKEEGVKLIRLAANMDNPPPYVSLLAGSLLKREGLSELVVEHLRAMLVKETDPGIRETLKAQLYQAIGERAARDIEATQQIQGEWRSKMAYVPFDIFLLAQPFQEITIEEMLDPTIYTSALDDDLPVESE